MFIQWSHRLPEKTFADMFKMMQEGEVCEYIRSAAELPQKHNEADPDLQGEVRSK